jgi:hypothetical protein
VKKCIYPLLLILLIISSCKKTNPPPNLPFVTDVYVVGYKVINNTTWVGVCWKNGQQVSITSDLNSEIYAVVAVGPDVYLAGNTSVGATYWKNGNPVYLAKGSVASAYAIAVSGNDVYVGGAVYKSGDNYGRAAYWKNGIETDLTDGKVQAYVNAIAVSGTDVYCAGQNNLPDNGNNAGLSVAACWKNQTIVPLNNALTPSYGSYAKAISISGNDVYVAGYIEFSAALWKNGVQQPLANNNGPLGSFAFSVAINGNDVFVGGAYGNEAAYWKNGTITNLISGAFMSSGIQGICFYAGDVYMCGAIISTPTYWKNDTPYTLQNNGEFYVVNAMSVSEHQ